jgi:hypothetical protein
VRPLEFGAFLELALRLLKRQAPGCYARLGDAVRSEAVHIAVDGRPLVVRFRGGRHEITAPTCAATVEICTDRAAILALIDDELSLLEAILSERLWVQGSAEGVERFDEALQAFLDGALRAPSFPALLDAFRSDPPLPGATGTEI